MYSKRFLERTGFCSQGKKEGMKWVVKLVSGGGKKRTPIPPKPYQDVAHVTRHATDPRYYDPDDLKHIDPEKPHWEDPRFESRASVPFFDLFGFNRDWSWSLFKLTSVFGVLLIYHELRQAAFAFDEANNVDMRVTAKPQNVSPVPDYARNDKATAAELREAGFAYVGTKRLDHLQQLNEQRDTQSRTE